MPAMVAGSDSTTVFKATAVLAGKLKASGVVSITIVVLLNTGFTAPTVKVVFTRRGVTYLKRIAVFNRTFSFGVIATVETIFTISHTQTGRG